VSDASHSGSLDPARQRWDDDEMVDNFLSAGTNGDADDELPAPYGTGPSNRTAEPPSDYRSEHGYPDQGYSRRGYPDYLPKLPSPPGPPPRPPHSTVPYGDSSPLGDGNPFLTGPNPGPGWGQPGAPPPSSGPVSNGPASNGSTGPSAYGPNQPSPPPGGPSQPTPSSAPPQAAPSPTGPGPVGGPPGARGPSSYGPAGNGPGATGPGSNGPGGNGPGTGHAANGPMPYGQGSNGTHGPALNGPTPAAPPTMPGGTPPPSVARRAAGSHRGAPRPGSDRPSDAGPENSQPAQPSPGGHAAPPTGSDLPEPVGTDQGAPAGQAAATGITGPAAAGPGGGVPAGRPQRRTRVHHLREMKDRGEKWAMLTAYDQYTAEIFDQAGIPVLLVGDSAANNVFGYESTLRVSMDELIPLARAVATAAQRSLVVADLPFGSYQASAEQAFHTAVRFMKEAGVHAVKLEGGRAVVPQVELLVQAGIPVMAHIGFTPQSEHGLGGYRVQGRGEQAATLIADAVALAAAGAFAVVLEMVPGEVAAEITKRIPVPTIGIGAGRDCDAQVLVWQDMAGFRSGPIPRFVKQYADLRGILGGAAAAFAADVTAGSFPADEHTF